jgi:type II secretory pathway pseudopilin PulG
MKQQSVSSTASSVRCAHFTSGGRQCRLLASDAHSGLCPRHHAQQKQKEAKDLYAPLIRNWQGFQTAQGINFSLTNLYELLAQNRISPRRAAVLSYISSLLLRTLPQIDADLEAGVTDPTKPKAPPTVEPDEETDEDSDDVSDDIADDLSGDGSGDTHTWAASNPEPDPNRKPS